jgi:putative nucleotidyltransferase with HDIG domain
MNDLPVPLTPAEEGENLAQYAGRWVALVGERVIGQGGTPDQALRAAKAARPKEIPQIIFVPIAQPLAFSELLAQVAAAIPDQVPLHLVGGAVRDALLGRSTLELDFALPEQVMKYARQVANRLGAAFFPLDQERDTARLILIDPPGQRRILDFAAYRGPDLESDLRGRDFTVNAMALDLRRGKALLDPLGGAADLQAKRLRACSPTSMKDDPLRVLRAVRIAAAYDFHILPETRSQMHAAVNQLPAVSPERLRDELFKILSGPQPHKCIRALDMLGVLSQVLPELVALKGVQQSPPHVHDVWEHTLGVLQQLDNVLKALYLHYSEESAANLLMGLLVLHLGRYRQEIDQHFQTELNIDRSLRGLLFLAALYHDIGKPQTKSVDESNRIRFFQHDQVGEKLLEERARSLRLSNLEIERARTIVRHHLRPVLLSQSSQPVTRKAIYRYFKDTGPAGVDVCLLSLADVLATYDLNITSEQWVRHLDVVRSLLQAWWEKPQESVSPPSIINGNELMEELNLQPGPVVGLLLEAIRENQAVGKIHAKDDAISLAKDYLKDIEAR